jgi:hypothetical protein
LPLHGPPVRSALAVSPVDLATYKVVLRQPLLHYTTALFSRLVDFE